MADIPSDDSHKNKEVNQQIPSPGKPPTCLIMTRLAYVTSKEDAWLLLGRPFSLFPQPA